MPVRIYSLAKELKLDSKVLADICTTAGVTGKGSALASLTDEEVERVKAYLSKMSQPRGAGRTAGGPAAAVAAEAGVLRREDYIAPGGVTDKKPELTPRLGIKPKKKSSETEPSKPTLRAPGIKLPPLPPTAHPVAEAGPQELAPQKPDLKLPADAIRASRGGAGTTPLSDHMRKHEAKKRLEELQSQATGPALAPGAKKGGPPPKDRPPRPRVPDMSPEVPAEGRDRSRRSRGGGEAKASPSLLGSRELRQLNRKRVTGTEPPRQHRVVLGAEDEEATTRRRRGPRIKRQAVSTAAPRKGKITVTLPCSVRSFSEAVGVGAQEVMRRLLALGTAVNINAEISPDLAELVAVELGMEVEFKRGVDPVEQKLAELERVPENPEALQPRPPVITFLGHVDHGKTSLLDKIIGINVARGESGGITQHIRAYQIEKTGRKISFVDTPGHEAFTEMRARGANVTDIAVLVVAADDGVMPQTEEAISHARAAGVPIVVALNKIDLPGVDPQRIYQQLAMNNLLPTDWGGDTEVVKTSATTGAGIDDLLETLLTIAELHDYRADAESPATGTCLEAELHEGRGVVAKIIVQRGCLKVGDLIVCGGAFGRVKAMYDTLNPQRTFRQAGPSMPANITGLDVPPGAGDRFYVLADVTLAREIAQARQRKSREDSLAGVQAHVTLENLFDRLGGDEAKTLNMIIRADVRGSIEAIQKELTKLVHPEVKIKVLQATVGGITEADVHLADASDAVIIGFNVTPDEGARSLAERKGVQIRRYEIIYKVTEDIKAALEGMLKPEQRETELGRAVVLRTFVISRAGTIAGCRVLQGVIQRSGRARVIRDNRVIGEYGIESLKREKDDAREVREGLECGIKLSGFNDVKEGDVLEVFKIEEVARTF